MKRIFIIVIVLAGLLITFTACQKDMIVKKETSTSVDTSKKDVKTISQELTFVNPRVSPVYGFAFKDFILNTDTVTCTGRDTLGSTSLICDGKSITSLIWKLGGYMCLNIHPLQMQVTVIDGYTVIITENGNLGQDEYLLVCQGQRVVFLKDLETVTVKGVTYNVGSKKYLEVTCNDSWVRSGPKPDYSVIVDL